MSDADRTDTSMRFRLAFVLILGVVLGMLVVNVGPTIFGTETPVAAGEERSCDPDESFDFAINEDGEQVSYSANGIFQESFDSLDRCGLRVSTCDDLGSIVDQTYFLTGNGGEQYLRFHARGTDDTLSFGTGLPESECMSAGLRCPGAEFDPNAGTGEWSLNSEISDEERASFCAKLDERLASSGK